MRIVHDDENAIVGCSVEGNGVEHHEGVLDALVHRGSIGIKVDIVPRILVGYAYRHAVT